MTPEQAKALQKQNARIRSKQAPRRNSSQALSSETQSEVTDRAPNLYRTPQINVPDDLQGVTKLIQSELSKIEQSQSVLLTMWEKLRGQVAGVDSITFTKQVNFDVNPTVNNQTGWNVVPQYAQPVTTSVDAAPWGWAMVPGIPDAPGNTYGTLLTMSSGGTYSLTVQQAVADPNYWLQQLMIDTASGVYVRTATNGNGWGVWGVLSAALSIKAFKSEIYAELLELNPELVTPSVD